MERIAFEIKWRVQYPFRPVSRFLRYVLAYREPRIVSTPDTLGGRPRLDGTRLPIAWFVFHRERDMDWWRKYYPYLSEHEINFVIGVVNQVENALNEIKECQSFGS